MEDDSNEMHGRRYYEKDGVTEEGKTTGWDKVLTPMKSMGSEASLGKSDTAGSAGQGGGKDSADEDGWGW
jgi:hypothetical protein